MNWLIVSKQIGMRVLLVAMVANKVHLFLQIARNKCGCRICLQAGKKGHDYLTSIQETIETIESKN